MNYVHSTAELLFSHPAIIHANVATLAACRSSLGGVKRPSELPPMWGHNPQARQTRDIADGEGGVHVQMLLFTLSGRTFLPTALSCSPQNMNYPQYKTFKFPKDKC